MPNYEYQCECGKLTIRTFPFGKKPQYIICKCQKRAKKIMSKPAIHFIGEGFTTGNTTAEDLFDDPSCRT